MKELQLEIDEKTYLISIGENKFENDLILKKSSQNDTWFHLENDSSPFIILHNNGDFIHKSFLNNIASMFVNYKKNLENVKSYNVIYTIVKNVKRTNEVGKVLLKTKPYLIKV